MSVADRPQALKIWLLATRPKTWFASISPVLLGTAMAMKDGFFNPWLFIFTFLTALGVQIGTNLANDYFDCIRGADTDKRLGPTRVTQAGLVTKTTMRRAIVISFCITALCGCYLILHGGFVMAALIGIAILLGIAYTAGPFPIGYLGLSEFFIVFFFGSLAVAGTYFLQTGQWSPDAWLIGLGPGLLSCAILVVNNLRDVEQDRAAGKKTLVVRLGKRFGKCEYLFFVLGAMAIPLLFTNSHPLALLCWLSLPPAIPLMVMICRENDPASICTLLPKTGQLLFFYTLLLCIGWML